MAKPAKEPPIEDKEHEDDGDKDVRNEEEDKEEDSQVVAGESRFKSRFWKPFVNTLRNRKPWQNKRVRKMAAYVGWITEEDPDAPPKPYKPPPPPPTPLKALEGSYWFTRVIFLRCLGCVYFTAFMIGFDQNKELIGDGGLMPMQAHLKAIAKVHQNATNSTNATDFYSRFQLAPTLFWALDPWDKVNDYLDGVAIVGMTFSALIIWSGAANMIVLTLLWLLYHSLVNVGQTWYSFGWESQLLETGFLAIWIVPLLAWSNLPYDTPTPWIAVAGYRWLLMRVMLGAGLIKLRGDSCWRDFSCMNHFYETQPIPNPYSYSAHFLPWYWHSFEVLGNHAVELILPLLTLFNRRKLNMMIGLLQILFQCILISTGNLSFLNWLTILPSLWYFDDAIMGAFFDRYTVEECQMLRKEYKRMKMPWYGFGIRSLTSATIGTLIASRSLPIIINMLSSKQIMNTSYDSYRLVNTYGAFGHVTKQRTEIIFEGTWSNRSVNPDAVWYEYEFKCKPGNVKTKPCQISPYHYRIDWLMWFATMQKVEAHPWIFHLAGKMLDNDPIIDSLLAKNPFKGLKKPVFVRAKHYKYEFSKPEGRDAIQGKWWKRKYFDDYLQPVNKYSVQRMYRAFGWKN